MKPGKAKVSSLVPDPRNPNRHTQRGTDLVKDSVRRLGAGRSILIDKNGKIIAGNATAQAAGSAGMEELIIVKSDGTKLVAVQREDLDLDKDPAARELSIIDNRSADLNIEFDPDVLKELDESGVDLERAGIRPDELQSMLDDAAEQDAGAIELRQLSTKPPPKMTWVLIGIPTVRFGDIAEKIETIAHTKDVVSEIVSNDENPQDRQPQPPSKA